MRSAIGDMAVDDDEGGYIVRLAKDLNRLCDPFRVIGVTN
jgi:hypothetical protein